MVKKVKGARRKPSSVDGAEEEAVGPDAEAERPKKKKKKQVDAGADDDAELEAEAPPPMKKKKRRRVEEAEAEPEPDEAVADLPRKSKKGKVKAVAADDDDEGETRARAKEGKSKKRAVDDAGDGGGGAEGDEFVVFVGGIPWSVDVETLRKDFSECGKVTDVNLLTHKHNGLSRGVAFISFADEAGLLAALKYDGDDYGGRTLKVTRAEKRERPPEGKAAGKGAPAEFEVFIKSLSSHTEEFELREHFAKCGDIAALSLPTRAGGKCKGFAWITFEGEKAVKKALKLDGSELKGFAIAVERAGQHKSGEGKAAGKGKDKGKGKGKGKGKDKGKSSELEIFCNNLSYETTEESLRKYFEDCGEIERMHMPTKAAGKCMGFAWITFQTKEALRSALDKHQVEFEGRRIKVEKSGQHRADAGADEKG